MSLYSYFLLNNVRKQFSFSLELSDEEARELEVYLKSLNTAQILFGLRFSYNRNEAEQGGYLLPGRKSMVKTETSGLDASQAQWRLKRWKSMIKSYRDKGYSYPTISRIKKRVKVISEQKKESG